MDHKSATFLNGKVLDPEIQMGCFNTMKKCFRPKKEIIFSSSVKERSGYGYGNIYALLILKDMFEYL